MFSTVALEDCEAMDGGRINSQIRDAGLADPGLAEEANCATISVFGRLERGFKRVDLALTSHDFGSSRHHLHQPSSSCGKLSAKYT